MAEHGGPDGATSAVAASRRLASIDGLRACAALWVVLFHMRAVSGARFRAVPGLDAFARSGSIGVSLFLVLSGFVLFLPYAGKPDRSMRTGTFLRRRATRLLPAYYVTLGAVVLATAIAAGRAGFMRYDLAGLAGQTLTHATLTHQFFATSFYALNGSFWSLGLEWELYLVFPLLLLAVRRFGLLRVGLAVIAVNVVYRLALALVIGQSLIPAHSLWAKAVLPNLFVGRWAEFAVGMWVAELYATGRLAVTGRRALAALVVLVPVAWLSVGNPLSHLAFGAVFFALTCVALADDNPIARTLSWRPLVFVGLMSYSIYLVHQPLLQSFAAAFRSGTESTSAVFFELLLVLPIVFGVAWLLFVGVERRTMRRPVSSPSVASAPVASAPVAGADPVERRTCGHPEAEHPNALDATAGRLVRNVGVLTAGQIVTWSMTLAWTIVVPRVIGPTSIGMLATVWGITGILSVILGLGTEIYLAREIVAQPHTGPQLIGTALVLRLVLAPLFFGAAFAFAHVAGYGSNMSTILYLGTGATFLVMLSKPLLAIFQATEHMGYLALADVIDRSAQGALGIVVALAGFGAIGINAAWLGSALVVLVLSWYWARPLLRIEKRTTTERVRRLIGGMSAFWLGSLFFLVYLWLDAVMLSLLTRPTVVAWYAVPTRIFTTLLFVPVALSTAWLPRLVRSFHAGTVFTTARVPLELVGTAALPITAGVVIGARPVLSFLYGPAYDEAAVPMIILGLTLLPMYLNIVLYQVAVATGRQRAWTWIMVGAVVGNAMVNYALIRATQQRLDNGAIGASLAMLATELAIVGAALALLRHQVVSGVFSRRFGRMAIASSAMVIAGLATRPLGGAWSIAAAMLTFAALVLPLRLVSPAERAMVRSALDGRRGRATDAITG